MKAGARAVRGALCGVAAGAGLELVDRLVARRALVMHSPYAPDRMLTKLVRRYARRSITANESLVGGLVMRLGYCITLGSIAGVVRPLFPSSPWLSGTTAGLAIAAVESVALPLVAATPPVRAWRPVERRWLPVQASLFGIAWAYLFDCGVARDAEPVPNEHAGKTRGIG